MTTDEKLPVRVSFDDPRPKGLLLDTVEVELVEMGPMTGAGFHSEAASAEVDGQTVFVTHTFGMGGLSLFAYVEGAEKVYVKVDLRDLFQRLMWTAINVARPREEQEQQYMRWLRAVKEGRLSADDPLDAEPREHRT